MSAQLLTAARTGQVVRAERCAGDEQVEDRLGHVAGEGQAAVLVVHHGDLVQAVLRVRDAVGQGHHGLDEVTASPITQLERRM